MKTIERIIDQHYLESHPLKHAVLDTRQRKAEDVDYAMERPWNLVFGVGDLLGGYDIVQVSGNGSCVYIWANRSPTKPSVWYEKRWRLPPEDIAKLTRTLRTIRFVELARIYEANVADGTTAFIRLKCRTFEKTVYCDNHFPSQVMTLHELIWNGFLRTRAAGSAKSIVLPEYKPLPVHLPPTNQ